jgi:membrane associated rhomboid family serine protease
MSNSEVDPLLPSTISSVISTIIIVVYLLYISSIIKTVPCGNSVLERFYSNFFHVDAQHLFTNLVSLYGLSRVERKMGTKPFITLIIFSLVLNTILEAILHTHFPNIKCGIGFSGVIMTVITYELITTKKLDIWLLTGLFAMTIGPSLKSDKVSVAGHAVGVISGLIAGLTYKSMIQK